MPKNKELVIVDEIEAIRTDPQIKQYIDSFGSGVSVPLIYKIFLEISGWNPHDKRVYHSIRRVCEAALKNGIFEKKKLGVVEVYTVPSDFSRGEGDMMKEWDKYYAPLFIALYLFLDVVKGFVDTVDGVNERVSKQEKELKELFEKLEKTQNENRRLAIKQRIDEVIQWVEERKRVA